MAYITAAEFKTYAGIDSSSADTKLATFITAAQAFIDDWTHTTFEASGDTTRTFDAVDDIDGTLLMFDQWLAQITSVTNGDGVVIPSNAYVLEPRNTWPKYGIRIKATSGYLWDFTDDPENAISIVGRWAYSITAPESIKFITKRLAHYLYQQKDNAGDLDRPMQIGDSVVLHPAQIPKDIKTELEKYVKEPLI